MDSLTPLQAEVLRQLRREAETHGEQTPRGIRVQLDPSKQDVASFFGLSRADATRALNGLKQSGKIAMEGSTIILLPE